MNSKKLIFLLLAFIVIHSAITLILPPASRASDLSIQNILNSVNKERTARNLLALTENNLLDAAAVYKADDMQQKHYFAHVDPSGHYIWDKIVSLGYSPYLELGENLAINFYDTESLTDAWMQSPGHRANILNENFKDQGMGLSLGDVQQDQYYSAIANTFGTLSVKTSPKVAANTTSSPAPTPTPQPTPKKTTTPAKTIPTPTPAPQPTSTKPTTTPVITIRESNESPSTTPVLAENPTSTPTSTDTTTVTEPEVVVSPQSTPLTSAKANRYLSLAFGFIILILLVSDSWTYIKEKGAHLDKKINNIALLILSLIVVGLMYWL